MTMHDGCSGNYSVRYAPIVDLSDVRAVQSKSASIDDLIRRSNVSFPVALRPGDDRKIFAIGISTYADVDLIKGDVVVCADQPPINGQLCFGMLQSCDFICGTWHVDNGIASVRDRTHYDLILYDDANLRWPVDQLKNNPPFVFIWQVIGIWRTSLDRRNEISMEQWDRT